MRLRNEEKSFTKKSRHLVFFSQFCPPKKGERVCYNSPPGQKTTTTTERERERLKNASSLEVLNIIVVVVVAKATDEDDDDDDDQEEEQEDQYAFLCIVGGKF